MVAEIAIDTINNAADYVAAIVPVKSRTATSLSTCSVATEEGIFESRDAVAVETRGVVGARDGYCERCAMGFPLFDTPKSVRSLESLVPSNPASNEEAVAAEDSVSYGGGDGGNSSSGCSSCSVLPLLTRTGDNIDAALQRTGENIDAAIQCFYSSLEIRAERLVMSCVQSAPCTKSSSDGEGGDTSPSDTEAAPQTASDLFAATEDDTIKTIKNAKSQDTTMSIKTQGTNKSIRTQGTTKSFRTQSSLKSTLNSLQIDNEVQTQLTPNAKSSCCFMSVFTCTGGDQENKESESTSKEVQVPHMTIDEIIGETLNITSSRSHILDTFSDDNTYGESVGRRSQRSAVDLMTPRAQYLLNEIEEIENSLFEVRKTASMEKVGEIQKRQDPFIQKMATIKQHLLDQQTLLQSAPEDTKNDYYRAISHAAMLNAEVETRRAELELKKIRLESMMVEEEMERMMVLDDSLDDTCDDTYDSLDQSQESVEGAQRAFDIFARYTASKFHKMRRNRRREPRESEC